MFAALIVIAVPNFHLFPQRQAEDIGVHATAVSLQFDKVPACRHVMPIVMLVKDTCLGTYVQYGCGLSCPPSWINFDVSPTLRLQRLPLVASVFKRGPTIFPDDVQFGDIVKGLPLPDNSVDGVYASHVLEHLAYDDFWSALRNTHRLLKPGGYFRLIVPDLEMRARKYLEQFDGNITGANTSFMEMSNLGSRSRKRGIFGFVHTYFGNSAHQWMWDEKSMRAALEKSGFVKIRRCRFNDSIDKHFLLVEEAGRFQDLTAGIDECAMEAQRPI